MGELAKLHLYLQPLPIARIALVGGTTVFYKTGLWCPKGWGLLLYIVYNLALLGWVPAFFIPLLKPHGSFFVFFSW